MYKVTINGRELSFAEKDLHIVDGYIEYPLRKKPTKESAENYLTANLELPKGSVVIDRRPVEIKERTDAPGYILCPLVVYVSDAVYKDALKKSRRVQQ